MMQSELEQIAQIAKNSLNSLSRVCKISPASQSSVHIVDGPTLPPLNLPPAHTYLTAAQHRELPPTVVEYCNRTLQDLALKTQEVYAWTVRRLQASGSHPDVKSLEDVIGITRRALENRYHQQSLQHIQRLHKYLSRGEKLSNDKGSKPTFNHEYTPLLEEYFEYNAYPSGSDKESLARRTGMTHRQIEVWFQNHRNRAKKDGRPLRRPLDSGFLQTKNEINNPLSSSQSFPPAVFTDTETEESDIDSVSPVDTNKEMPYTILDASPSQPQPHAFPAPYRHQSIQEVTEFAPVSWPRRASSHKQVHGPVDVDELVSSFALKLTIGNGDCNSLRRKKAGKQSIRKNPWFESRVTIVPSAPLPALHQPSKQSREKWQKRHAGGTFRYPPSFSREARSRPFAEPEFGPTRHCRRLRPGCTDNQKRKTSTTSTSSFYSSGTSEDSSSCSELLTPPASPLLPLAALSQKASAFDIEEWRSEAF